MRYERQKPIYKVGDKFIIEILEVQRDELGNVMYRVSDNQSFYESFLNNFDKIGE